MLFDFYSNLLTDKQRTLFEHHYQFDLSLGEIGNNLKISRQAVHDLLRRTIAQLNHYEERLALLEKHQRRSDILADLELALTAQDLDRARELTSMLTNL